MSYSCIYEGHLRHRRFTPVENVFTYPLFMMYLDLDELPTLFHSRWLWSTERSALARFRREDHLGPADTSLPEAVRTLVAKKTGRRPSGPIRLLTHLSYFGYRFNPVSFYYCFDRHDQRVESIVAEVNNTPWGEQHCYVLDEADNQAHVSKKRYRLHKEFHVSPFMDMDVEYEWYFTEPAKHLTVHMDSRKKREKFFDATLTLQQREINGKELARVLVRYPMMTIRVIAAIHYQALKLWLKGVTFFPHPGKSKAPLKAVRP